MDVLGGLGGPWSIWIVSTEFCVPDPRILAVCCPMLSVRQQAKAACSPVMKYSQCCHLSMASTLSTTIIIFSGQMRGLLMPFDLFCGSLATSVRMV
eukprot:s56_g11.t1